MNGYTVAYLSQRAAKDNHCDFSLKKQPGK